MYIYAYVCIYIYIYIYIHTHTHTMYVCDIFVTYRDFGKLVQTALKKLTTQRYTIIEDKSMLIQSDLLSF